MKNLLHKGLDGRWQKMSFLEQMANIGSEVYRAINWKKQGNEEYAHMAFVRSLELFDLTKESKLTGPQLKELCRMRELWVDFFAYNNEYNSTEEFINNYFVYLTVAFRKL
jgi:hypothetical protein